MKYTLFLLFLLPFALLSQSDTCLNYSEIGISFPPVADQTQRDFAQLHLDELGVQRIRFAEDWSLREPTQGNFNWGPLDERISWASSNNYDVLLTIQSRGPSWACGNQNGQSCVFLDNAYFQTYLDSLLQRYPNQIDKIQFGNEWQSDFWYVGNAQEFIESNNTLYNSVQTYSPTTQVVLGGFTTISLRFLAACNGYDVEFYDDDGNFYDSTLLSSLCNDPAILSVRNRIDSVLTFANYDQLDIHLYDDVELWPILYENFTDTLNKPVIVSEFGGPNMFLEPYSEAYQADKLFEYIKVLDSLEIPEIYYFKLVEGTANPAHSTSGLIEDTTLATKAAYYIIQSFINCNSAGLVFPEINGLKFYPNPAKDWISFEFDNPDLLENNVVIYNAKGELIFEQVNAFSNYFYLSTKNIASGAYYIYVRSENKLLGKGKIIVSR